jgi:hypothetical protein
VNQNRRRGAVMREVRKQLGMTQISLWESAARPLPGYRLDSLYRIVEFTRPGEQDLLKRIDAAR